VSAAIAKPADQVVIEVPGDAEQFMKLVARGILIAGAHALHQLVSPRLQTPVAIPADEPSEVMSADEVAEFLGVDRNTVYDYAGRGVIPSAARQANTFPSRSATVVVGRMQGHVDSERLIYAGSTNIRRALAIPPRRPLSGRNARAHQWLGAHEDGCGAGDARAHRALPSPGTHAVEEGVSDVQGMVRWQVLDRVGRESQEQAQRGRVEEVDHEDPPRTGVR
jgi:hypothetical protein